MKHAYLIIAHHNFHQLQILINLLDDVRNDIYVHIDKKSDLPILEIKKSNLYLLDSRIDVRWGDVSQIKCELLLFESAFKRGPYLYYHLISGADLPIKSQDFIHDFFSKNRDKEFVGIASDPYNIQDCKFKTCRYHFFTRHYHNRNLFSRIFYFSLRLVCESIFNFVFKVHIFPPLVFKKGPQWVSITNNFCSYLLAQKDKLIERYKYVMCSDEIFLQTVLWNSPFKDSIYKFEKGDQFLSCMREIDWQRGEPYTWGQSKDDFDELCKSKKLFARKFDLKTAPDIIEKVSAKVKCGSPVSTK